MQLLNWAVRGKGALTSTACDRGLFVKTNEKLSQPDLQVRYVAGLALDSNAIGSYVKFGKMKVRRPSETFTPVPQTVKFLKYSGQKSSRILQSIRVDFLYVYRTGAGLDCSQLSSCLPFVSWRMLSP